MLQTAADSLPTTQPDTAALLDALLHAIPHDLRSPLLTVSLSGELLRQELGAEAARDATGAAAVALEALTQGARDMERMLDAIARLARARVRPLEGRQTPLRMLLGGHVVVSDEADVASCLVHIDLLLVHELLEATCGEDPASIEVTLTDRFAVLEMPRPTALDDVRGLPLLALCASLQQHAGTPVEDLAVGQLVIERLGGALEVDAARVRVWLPRANATDAR